jgi:hypothetical protein
MGLQTPRTHPWADRQAYDWLRDLDLPGEFLDERD